MTNKLISTIVSRFEILSYPMAVMFNSFSMTLLLVIVGFMGLQEEAASIGLVQGATLATFFVFSANGRNLVLSEKSELNAASLLKMRLLLFFPLAGVAFFLCVHIGGVSYYLAFVLLLRRAFEWFGEIGISQLERQGHVKKVQYGVAGEIFALLLCVTLLMIWKVDLAFSALPWVFAPLVSVYYSRHSLRGGVFHKLSFKSVIPHLGSTSIIGISVYVFRISIVVLVGKLVAGDLFAAFAIGGVIPTIFGQAIAPTLVRLKGLSLFRSVWAGLFLVLMLIIATTGILIYLEYPIIVSLLGRNEMFWMAMGLSLLGGSMMAIALFIRAYIINSADSDAFGPDSVANILTVLLIPVVYFVLGVQYLVGLYLLSSLLNLLYLFGLFLAGKRMPAANLQVVLITIGIMLLVPFFINQTPNPNNSEVFFGGFDSIINYPLPISFFTLFIGIAVISRYKDASYSLAVVFASVVLAFGSIFYVGGDELQLGAKFILLPEFIFPMFGLVLGEMYAASSRKPLFERSALFVLGLFIPVQIIFSLISTNMQVMNGIPLEVKNYYQNYPGIVVALSVVVLIPFLKIYSIESKCAGILLPFILYYLYELTATTQLLSLLLILILNFYLKWIMLKEKDSFLLKIILLLLFVFIFTFCSISESYLLGRSTYDLIVSNPIGLFLSPLNSLRELMSDSAMSLFFGHVVDQHSNFLLQENGYLYNLLSNFGLIVALPLFYLFVRLNIQLWKLKLLVIKNHMLLGLMFSSSYLILVGGIFGNEMQNIFVGVITFFIVGLLIGRLKLIEV